MKLHRLWMLPVGLLLVIGTLGCGGTARKIERLGGKAEADATGSIANVDFFGTQIGDADLELMKGLTKLQSLNLRGSQITGAGLEHLKGLTNLESLLLGSPQITDAGLERL